jgi:hypothetical protein
MIKKVKKQKPISKKKKKYKNKKPESHILFLALWRTLSVSFGVF